MSAKLINEQDHSTFTNAFSKAARLPTEQDRKAALELSAADMRKELFQPKYQANAQRDTRRAGSGSGWANEVPIGPPPGIAIIDQLCNTLMPHEPVHGADLEKLLAKVGITREQFEARVAERVKQMKA